VSTPTQTHEHEPPLRDVPALPWRRVAVIGLVLFAVSMGGWEFYWANVQEFTRGYRDGSPMWAYSRGLLEQDLDGSTAMVGSSRILFDIDLEQWQRDTGSLPYQLALMGTSPRPFLEDIALESEFGGLLVVGVTSVLFFTPLEPLTLYYGDALDRYRELTPSQRVGYRVSRIVEPWLAFYHWDAALFMVLRRQTWWPERPGYIDPMPLGRRLADTHATRQVDMWHKLDNDPAHQAIIQDLWHTFLTMPMEPPPPGAFEQLQENILQSVTEQVGAIRGRGGDVVFVRFPSSDEFRDFERQVFPREMFWDRLIEATGAVGIHFEDYPELQDVRLPEWSHIHSEDKTRFTAALIRIVRDELAAAGTPRQELGP
jgi:hypothetical protein